MNIKNIVYELKEKYQTNNPYEIACCKNIEIVLENLGSINGYYNKILRMKQIHINRNLSSHIQNFTCAHELGHAILHPNSNTPFLRANTYFSINKIEIEANIFAVELLISDEEILEYKDFDTKQLSRIFGYSEQLIKLKLK